ncbi:8763_t:CDS:2 [Funneliformis geosporum]|nr:8763_t:CDS:2 [Funneliformis geosporum]
MTSPHNDTKSHVSHIAQSYTDVKGEQKHELNDQYVQPVKEPSTNLPFDQQMAIEKGSYKQKADREIKEDDEEVLRKKDQRQTKKMPAKNTTSISQKNNQFNESINNFDHNETSKNILIGSFIGGWNQLRPLIEICKILMNRGHNVTLISPGKYSSPSSDYPIIHHISSGPSFDLSIIPEYREILSEEYMANETIKVDLFFCDLFLNEACIDVAWLMNKPLVTMSSKLYPMMGCHVNMEREPFLERFRCAIIAPIQMNYVLSPYTKRLNELRKSLDVSNSESFEKLQNSLFLADTFFGFETPHQTPPLYQEIGPIMSDNHLPLTKDLNNFIALHRRIIYVNFGTQVCTTYMTNVILLQAFIEAINNNIIDGIIWKLTKSSSKVLFPSTIMLSGSKTIINTSNHPSIHIIEESPQFAILNHSNIKIHLTHGGIGSIYESLFTGTPMLLLPIAFDQFGNSEKLLENGVGLLLSKVSLDVQDIIRKIQTLQKDKYILINVERMKSLAILNSKRKFRAADLIEFVLYSNQLNSMTNFHENSFKEDLKIWRITPEMRLGLKYLDVYVSLLMGFLIIIMIIIWVICEACKFIFGNFISFFTGHKMSQVRS